MPFEKRKCPYCNEVLDRPYWRHVQIEHPKKFEEDRATWVQLYKDYREMGMTDQISITAICELFNKSEEEVRNFLKHKGLI